jgi:oxalate decarboxylase/phosphoglucose isomerase-like protein (cupin superfamily)
MDAPNIVLLEDTGDQRGFCYSVPQTCLGFLPLVKGAAVLSVKPGAVRGNHFHKIRLEMVMITFSDTWTFFYQGQYEAEPTLRKFEGQGMAIITVPPLCSHAIRNDGQADLTMVDMSNIEHDPDHPDAIPSVITG